MATDGLVTEGVTEPDVPPQRTRTPRRQRRWLRIVLLVIVPVLLLAGGYWAWRVMSRYASTDDAYVQTDIASVSPQVSGDVIAVLVRENDHVRAGQALLEIDSEEAHIAVAHAEAQLESARTDIEAMKANYALQNAQRALAEAQAQFAETELQRQQELADRNLASQADLDKAKQNYQLMHGLALVMREQMRGTAIKLAGHLDTPVDEHPQVRAALTELERARLQLKRTRLHAPRAGVVSRVPDVGDFLAAGAPALAIVADGNAWVEANFKETDLTRMRPGQPVRIEVDTYPDVTWHGRVESIAQATGAQFALLPPQNASGNWVKVVQRIPVRIEILPQPDAPPLRAGMSTTVRVDLSGTSTPPQLSQSR